MYQSYAITACTMIESPDRVSPSPHLFCTRQSVPFSTFILHQTECPLLHIYSAPDRVSPSPHLFCMGTELSMWKSSNSLSLSSQLRCYCRGSSPFLPLPGLYCVVWLAEVGYSVFTLFIVLMLESVHSNMQGILCVPTILTWYEIAYFLVLQV